MCGRRMCTLIILQSWSPSEAWACQLPLGNYCSLHLPYASFSLYYQQTVIQSPNPWPWQHWSKNHQRRHHQRQRELRSGCFFLSTPVSLPVATTSQESNLHQRNQSEDRSFHGILYADACWIGGPYLLFVRPRKMAIGKMTIEKMDDEEDTTQHQFFLASLYG